MSTSVFSSNYLRREQKDRRHKDSLIRAFSAPKNCTTPRERVRVLRRLFPFLFLCGDRVFRTIVSNYTARVLQRILVISATRGIKRVYECGDLFTALNLYQGPVRPPHIEFAADVKGTHPRSLRREIDSTALTEYD